MASARHEDPKAKLDARIARTLEQSRNDMLDTCTSKKPAQIVAISFSPSTANLVIRWPFVLPEPSGDLGWGLATKRQVEHLGNEFRNYLLRQRAGPRLANIFYKEFSDFLDCYFHLQRFPLRIRERISKTAERRLADPHKEVITKETKLQVQRLGRQIITTLEEMQGKIRAWQKKTPRIKDATIWGWLCDEYDSDDFAWMRAFKTMKSKIPPRKSEKSRIGSSGYLPPATLSEPDRWKTFDLAVKLTCEQWYLDTGARLPASEVGKLLKPV